MTPAITLENITYTYSRGTPFAKTALDDVSLEIAPNVITGIMGHTGSGKSTLVQHLNGLLEPQVGKVLVFGEDIWENKKTLRQVRYDVGLVFQYPEYQLFDETVRSDIGFGPRNMGLDSDEIARRVENACRFVGLDEKYLDKSPFELSGGQKRRVAIAGVMAMEPKILILDEPAAGLDPMGREGIFGGIRAYQRESGTTVLIVSHSMEDIARYSDNVVVMKDSRLLFSGEVREIFRKAEELADVGLSVPQVTRLMHKLRHTNPDIRDDIFTVEEARDYLDGVMKPLRQLR